MSERDELARLIEFTSHCSAAALAGADRILAAGYHKGPRIPAHGSPEEAAMVERMTSLWPLYDMDPRFREDMLAALRAAFPEEGE